MALAYFLLLVVIFGAGWACGAIFGFGAGPAWRRYKKRIIDEYEAEKAKTGK